MALPENKISKVKLPNNTEYDIVPKVLQDGTTNFSATLPTLTEDSVLALTSDLDSRVSTLFLNAPEYSSSSTYTSGNKVVHDGKLYRCNTTIYPAEAWNPAHWTEITISNYVDTSSEQIIGGEKYFTGDIMFYGSATLDDAQLQINNLAYTGAGDRWSTTFYSDKLLIHNSAYVGSDLEWILRFPEFEDGDVKTLAVKGEVIEKVASEQAIPDNELGLYRFTEEVSGVTQSSHVYEVVKEDHGAEEREFYKTTTTNGTQLTTSTFLGQFYSTLTNFVSTISTTTNVYCFYYDNEYVSRNGIRIGTKNTGTLTFTCTEDGSITFGKYFSYNGSTHVVTYDADSAVIVDGTKYEFEGSDEDTITIDITAGQHTITSNGQDITGGSQTGRIVLISFEFEGEPYSIFSPKALARVEEVNAVDTDLQSYKTTVHNRFVTDEANIEVNRQGIADINSRMGDIQAFQAGNSLPNPSVEYLNKIYRLDGKFYQCIQKGDGVLKEITFDTVTGTSEVTLSNVNGFIADLDREDFSEYYYLVYNTESDPPFNSWSKVFRNNGDIRLGSSSSVGDIEFDVQDYYYEDLPMTKLKIGVKAYNQNGSTVNFELAGYISYSHEYEQFIDNPDTETLIDLTDYLEESEALISFYIETKGSHLVDEELVNNDKRIYVTRIIAEFGTVEYEWQEISGGGSSIESLITPITYDELKALRDSNELIPGMQYRITDYSCTTTQFDTRSAGHNFDIIVTADSTHILNENARACINDNDITYFKKASGADWINPRPTSVYHYFLTSDDNLLYGQVPPATQGEGVHGSAQLITDYTIINYNGKELPAMFNPDPETATFTNSVVSVQYTMMFDEESQPYDNYKPDDVFVELGYIQYDGDTYPVLYKTNYRRLPNETDYYDIFLYDGDYEFDNVIHSKWVKCQGSPDYPTDFYVLTQRIVVNNEFTITQEQLTAGITITHESSENDLYYVYDGTETIMEGVENTLCHALYAVNEDGEEVYADGSYKVEDTFVEISYETVDGVLTPVMYKNDLWNKEYVEEGTDYGDVFVYIGNLTVDGTTYNRWRKYEHGNIDPSDYTGFDVLTEVIVVNNQFTISQQEFTDAIQYNYVTYDKWKCLHASDLSPENGWYLTNKLVDNVYTESNLNTWELKYSLDNDTKRFGWALDGQQIVYNDVIYDRSSDNDNTNDNPDFTGYQIGWKSNDSSHNILYSPSETISSDDGLFNPAEEAVIFQPDYSVHTGKGVIYYMKDENNNECCYDFKNILFRRYKVESNNSFNYSHVGIDLEHFPEDVGTLNSFSLFAYTFSWLTEENEDVVDASVAYNELPDDEGGFDGVYNNTIKPYYDVMSDSPKLTLNNIVFTSRYNYETNVFYGIRNNYFEECCHDCSFLDSCNQNRFEKNSYEIFFAEECYRNVIGESSYTIVLNGFNYENYIHGNIVTIGGSSNNNILDNVQVIKCGPDYNRVSITNSSYIYFEANGNPVRGVEDIIIDSGCQYLTITTPDAYELQSLTLAKMHIHAGIQGTSGNRKIISKNRTSGGNESQYLYNYYATGTRDIILD